MKICFGKIHLAEDNKQGTGSPHDITRVACACVPGARWLLSCVCFQYLHRVTTNHSRCNPKFCRGLGLIGHFRQHDNLWHLLFLDFSDECI